MAAQEPDRGLSDWRERIESARSAREDGLRLRAGKQIGFRRFLRPPPPKQIRTWPGHREH